MNKWFSADNFNDFKWLAEDLESRTSCEVRLELRLDYEEGIDSIEAQATKDFYKEGMISTEGQVGILILVVLIRKECAILADEGITAKIPKEELDFIAKEVQKEFRKRRYVDGIRYGFFKLAQLLENHFPPEEESRNELVNDVIVDPEEKKQILE